MKSFAAPVEQAENMQIRTTRAGNPYCLPSGRLERLPVPRGVEDKGGDILNVNTEI